MSLELEDDRRLGHVSVDREDELPGVLERIHDSHWGGFSCEYLGRTLLVVGLEGGHVALNNSSYYLGEGVGTSRCFLAVR